MRGVVAGLPSSRPIGEGLPALLRADDFCERFVAGLDEVMAPILLTIDNLDAYVDPDVAPMDFVAWLAAWFGVTLDPTWDDDRCRRTVSRLAAIHRRRGTVSALGDLAAALTDAEVEVADGGGVWTTLDPRDPLPGERQTAVTVTGPDGLEGLEPALSTFVPPGRQLRIERR